METGVFNVTVRNVLSDSANKKVKAVQLHAQKAYRGGPGIALTIHDPSARRGWVVSATPRLLYPRHPLYRRLGGLCGPSVWVCKSS